MKVRIYMKRVFMIVLALVISTSLAACGITVTPAPGASASDSESAVPELTPTPVSTPAATPAATPDPTPAPFGEEPDHAGSGDILFDIYEHTALVDLNCDGTPEEITLTAGNGSSTLQIGADTYTIDRENQAQLFAVTDVDITDGILELAFTDEYNDDLADTEFAFTYLYWWDGTDLKKMGGLMNMKFAGAWRGDFDPADNLDAHGTVMCLTRTQNFSDAWYTGHYVPDGADRKLKEDLYAAPVLLNQEPLTLKSYIILLKNIDSTLFDFSYEVCWDYASMSGGYGDRPRDYSDDYVSFIPQAGEELTIVKVYGKKWFKLRASDGKQGWLKCEDQKIFNYWQVMHYTAADIFDGIVIAG
jgi:hypothetical protein